VVVVEGSSLLSFRGARGANPESRDYRREISGFALRAAPE
jgi:hypothetical protein